MRRGRGLRSLRAFGVALTACGAPGGGDSGARTDALSDRGADAGSTDSGSPNDVLVATDSGSRDDGGDAAAPTCAIPSILDGFVARRTLHVSMSGNDSADGLTPTSAWATLAHASALQPGDEVRIEPGTYACPALDSVHGTAALPVHFVAAGAPRSAILDCTAGGMFLTNLQYVAFDALEVRHSPDGHCINLNSGGAPFRNLSEHVLFINLAVHDCLLSGIKSSQAFEIDIRNSEISHNTAAGNPLIDWVAVHDGRIVGNDIHDGADIGAQVKGGAYNCVIESNRIHDVADAAIQLGESTGTGFYLPSYTDWEASRSSAVNNLLYGSLRAGIAVQGCDACLVAHNTMWANAPAFYVRGLPTQNQSGATINDTGLVLVNNIFASRLPGNVPLNIVPPSDAILDQGYNLYFSPGGIIAGRYSDTPIAGSGNLVDSDPRFVDPTAPDLHLGTGSPALGAARATPTVMRTFGGACRVGNDLGAW